MVTRTIEYRHCGRRRLRAGAGGQSTFIQIASVRFSTASETESFTLKLPYLLHAFEPNDPTCTIRPKSQLVGYAS